MIYWLGKYFKFVRKSYFKLTGKYNWGLMTFLRKDYPPKPIDFMSKSRDEFLDEFLK